MEDQLLMKNVLIAQSGGPTAAINATVAGVVERALISPKVDKVYASLYGIKGAIEDNVVEIGQRLSSPQEMINLINTPSAALGSARHKLPEVGQGKEEYEKIFNTFKKHNIGYFICIGGNDSMDTVDKLTQYMEANNIEGISVMGAPKTIDNDLYGMDHSPGYASAARYVATTISELSCDVRVYDIPAVTIVEIMGREVGWLAAAASMAKVYGDAPNLIYLPEVTFDDKQFIADVTRELEKDPAVLIVVSEGIRYADGTFVGESEQQGKVDDFGHKRLAGTAAVLTEMVDREIGCKVRDIRLSLMQRSAGHLTSNIDLQESRMLGAAAMDRALDGVSGEVPVVNRTSNQPYRVEYTTIPVQQVANRVRAVPREWINDQGNFVTLEMIQYLAPLLADKDHGRRSHGLPLHFRLF